MAYEICDYVHLRIDKWKRVLKKFKDMYFCIDYNITCVEHTTNDTCENEHDWHESIKTRWQIGNYIDAQ